MERTTKSDAANIIVSFPKSKLGEVSFNRTELDAILKIYGHKVASGEWRDYAIDHLPDRAVFSIFRRASEVPLYRIEKMPENVRKQGTYSVISAASFVLKRGHDLGSVLKVIVKAKKDF